MAKVKTALTIPPLALATGKVIEIDDGRDVAANLNWAAAENPRNHVSIVTGGDGWGSSGNEIATFGISFATTSGYVRRFIGEEYIDSDDQVIGVAATVTCPAANTAAVRITVGSANAVLTPFPASATTTLSSTLNVSSTGDGWQTVTVELDHLTGSSGAVYLRDFWIHADAIAAASLPDPVDE